MRYTEARLQSLADDMMADLDKETVDFVPNYDETTEEPTVLPAPFPESSGQRIGRHCGRHGDQRPAAQPARGDRRLHLAHREHLLAGRVDDELTAGEKLRNLIRLIPGPDFPTAGYIVGRRGVVQALTTGRGSILMRAKSEIETNKKGDRQSIIVTEIPYQVNKAKLIERIAELVREKTIEGISDLRDESDREGMRIVIELKRGDVPEVVLNNLYKHTQLQLSFGIIMLAIVGGRPKVMNLLELRRELRRVPPGSGPATYRVRAAEG